MSKTKKQRYTGIVYSTDDSYAYESESSYEEAETLPNNRQRLTVRLDKKARKGKVVTVVEGFVGTSEDLSALAKLLKQKCAVGGSSKDGVVIIQGDFRDRLRQVLISEGYQVRP